MTDAPFDLPKAHRYFATEYNNQAWDLLDVETRTPEQTSQMIHAAHGARLHWQEVGTVLHWQRAECLLTTVYARVGNAEAALHAANRCLELSATAGDEQTPFDRATAFGCAALAYLCAGQSDKARELHEKALAVAETFTDPDDKAVFARFYG